MREGERVLYSKAAEVAAKSQASSTVISKTTDFGLKRLMTLVASSPLLVESCSTPTR